MTNQLKIRRFGALVGDSPRMRRVFELIERAARVDVPVLIAGETGTGKELVSRELHKRSARATNPFVAVNTGALPPQLVISELFGHVKGAFTGASDNKQGRFAEADSGTLFLDEVTTMDDRVQVALLRVLEDSCFRPVGAKNDKRVNVRLVAATNAELRDIAEREEFRSDLIHRLEVFRIDVPALREHVEDLPMLVAHFLRDCRESYGVTADSISAEALEALQSYDWPGNVRELKNVVAQAVVMTDDATIRRKDLPVRIVGSAAPCEQEADSAVVPVRLDADPEAATDVPEATEAGGGEFSPDTPGVCAQDGVFFPLGVPLEDVQRDYILETLTRLDNNKTQAARTLGISRKTLYDKLARWHIDADSLCADRASV